MVEKFVPEVGQSVLLSCNLNFVSFRALNGVVYIYVHCPKNNLDLRIKAKPVTDGADATVDDRLLSHKLEHLLGLYAERQYIFWDSVFSSQKTN